MFDLIVTEGRLDEIVALKLLEMCGIPKNSPVTKVTDGNDEFWSLASKYNEACRTGRKIFALADLEKPNKARANVCVPAKLNSCLPPHPEDSLRHWRHENFVIRIAVLEIENWLVADSIGVSKFLGKKPPLPNAPDTADSVLDAKQMIINVARDCSQQKLRKMLVPRIGYSSHVGPQYNKAMATFVVYYWDPERAAANSPSLRRAIDSLKSFRERHDSQSL